MKLHFCSNCGTVFIFDTVYEKSGWVATDNGERMVKCPVCVYAVRESEKNATIK